MMKHECRLLSQLSHPHLVRFVGACAAKGMPTATAAAFPICLVMEYMAGGTLHAALHGKDGKDGKGGRGGMIRQDMRKRRRPPPHSYTQLT